MLDSAMEKHAACAAAINCSGLEPGPSSKRDLNVYPPLMLSPAVNVPVPVGTSPFHSALPLAGMVFSFVRRLVPRLTGGVGGSSGGRRDPPGLPVRPDFRPSKPRAPRPDGRWRRHR